MSQVVSLENVMPPARFDDVPWTKVRFEEAAASTGTWAQIDEQDLDPVDDTPADPTAINLTTLLASNTPELWYRVIFVDDAGHVSSPSNPYWNVGAEVEPFVDQTELFRVLKIRDPSTGQQAAADRVLLTGAQEIMCEIGLKANDLTAGEIAICETVNLDRAADLWRHTESVPGVIGVLDDTSPRPTATGYWRYSWERYAERLAPIKRTWGIA